MLETNSGEEPFSELETQLFRDALTKLKPHIFLTVHSGTYGMYNIVYIILILIVFYIFIIIENIINKNKVHTLCLFIRRR